MLVAWIKVPGLAEPLAVADTHINSRRKSGVAFARANRTFAWQVIAAQKYIDSIVAPGEPVIFGGDFNIGRKPARNAFMNGHTMLGTKEVDGLPATLKAGDIPSSANEEAHDIIKRNKARILSREGEGTDLYPVHAWVPFGKTTARHPMSDHAGFVVDYRIGRKGET